MGIVTLGLFTQSIGGIVGAIVLMLAHGFVSSALFICVTLLYDRYHTRLVKYYRGTALIMPIYATIFLVFTLANIGFPGSCNFLGEFLVLLNAYKCHQGIALLAGLGVILSAAYSLFCYNRVSFGSYSPYLALTSDLTRREFHVLVPLCILTVY
jgi:NADH:ubiquinone oxidoreductase subunit 4 (subunit M)